jgi:transcriptional regulator with XRE-family HTH domain
MLYDNSANRVNPGATVSDHPPEYTTARLLARIDERLRELGKRASAACLEAGLGPDAIRDLRRGTSKNPSLRVVAQLARALEVTPEWLAFEAGSKHHQQNG